LGSKGRLKEGLRFLEEAREFKERFEAQLSPLEELSPSKPFTYLSIGGGELGDLVISAAKRLLGGQKGGIRTVVFDRYDGCPAQDVADSFEGFDMMKGDLLEAQVRKYIPKPSEPHAIYLEIEKIDTRRMCQLGIKDGYRVMSTPYGPLICMDRYLTKLMFDELRIPRLEWAYAESQREIELIADEFGLPVIVKPIMTSSGHGTSIVRTQEDLKNAYRHALEHARGIGDRVIVEKFLEDLKTEGTEITQFVVRHFDEKGKIVTSVLPPVEHKRPGATYHESWMPATISIKASERCQESARKIAEFIGGLGLFAVEQFVLGDEVYNNEVANRPHDTGMVTRWTLNADEGTIQLLSTIGLQVTPFDISPSRSGIFGVAHVILAPDFGGKGEGGAERAVLGWKAKDVKDFLAKKGYSGEVWYFGKPTAYPHRRMGLAVAFHEKLEEGRRQAEEIAHYAEGRIIYA
jgi:phosphoribosylglycinamide formyltransferase 2